MDEQPDLTDIWKQITQDDRSRQYVGDLYHPEISAVEVSAVNDFLDHPLMSSKSFGGGFAFDMVPQSARGPANTRMPTHHTLYSRPYSHSAILGNSDKFSAHQAREQQLPFLPPSRTPKTPLHCPDCHAIVRGDHELQRHRENMHAFGTADARIPPPQPLPHHASNSDPYSFPGQLDTSTSFSGPEAQKQPIPRLSTVHQTKAPLPCLDCRVITRGPQELQRHWENVHAPVKRVWICVQPEQSPLLPKKPLDICMPCKEGKHYSVLYNAVAHLRRVHFNPSKRSRSPRREAEHRSPAIDELKAQGWLMEISVPNNNPPSIPNDDENRVNGSSADSGYHSYSSYQPGSEIVDVVDRLSVDAMPAYDLPAQRPQYFIDPDQEKISLETMEMQPVVSRQSNGVNEINSSGSAHDRTAPPNEDTYPLGYTFDPADYIKFKEGMSGSSNVDVEISARGTPEPYNTTNIMHMTSATNSGYGTDQSGSKMEGQSVAEDDTEIIATDGSQALVQGQDKHMLEAAFAREISNGFNPLMQETFAVRSNMAMEMLYAFSVMIGKRASSISHRGVASFVRRGRNRIIGHVRKSLQPDGGEEQCSSVGDMSLAEKMALWGLDATAADNSPRHSLQLENNEIDCDDEQDDDDVNSLVPTEYAGLRAFLIDSDEFADLSHDLSLGLQAGEVDVWSNVRTQIAKGLASLPNRPLSPLRSYSLAINLPWSPRAFMREQYGHLPVIPKLGSVITLSGATGHIYAATAEDYIRATWPRYGQLVLGAVQHALDCQKDVYRTEMNHSALDVRFRNGRTMVTAIGHALFISSATEILVWLSTSCRASTDPDQIQACRMHLKQGVERGTDLTFAAELEIVKDVETDDSLHATCWHGMFRNPVIAHNYPTPHRTPQKMGLELSLDLMLALARTFWAAIYDGVLLLKGFNTILTPTLEVGDSVIWHLTVDRSGDRLSYNDGVGSSCLHSIGEATFDGARHFVGWATSADLLIGTQHAIFDSIGFSGGIPASAGLRAEAAVNFTAGKYLTLSSKVSRGIKDTPEYLPSDDYVQDIDAAARMGVVLSDTATWQHWLADGASVVLHLCRAWLAKSHPGYDPATSSIKLWSPQESGSPATSLATLTSIDNRELELYISHSKRLSKPSVSGRDEETVIERQWFLLQDLAHRYSKWIEQIHDRANKVRHSADVDLARQGNKVIGFDFMDLLCGTGRVEPYVLELGAGAEPWLRYTRLTDTVHILGSGFGELIRPRVTINELPVLCGQQAAVPQHADYLTAPLSVLKGSMERLQHTSTCAQLARGLYWWDTDEAFKNCRCQRAKASARCTSLVRKLHGKCPEDPSSRAPTCLPKVFERYPTGAIIMGYEPQLLVKIAPITDDFTLKSVDQNGRLQSGASRSARQQKRSPSDSGYASNVGNSSRDSQSSSLVSEDSVSEGFRIRGAAGETGGRKLTKRRKTDR